jgi:hypothetical protein
MRSDVIRMWIAVFLFVLSLSLIGLFGYFVSQVINQVGSCGVDSNSQEDCVSSAGFLVGSVLCGIFGLGSLVLSILLWLSLTHDSSHVNVNRNPPDVDCVAPSAPRVSQVTSLAPSQLPVVETA